NTVGGMTTAARNIVSGNGRGGIFISGQKNLVQGNFVGTDVTGAVDLGNSGDGVSVIGGPHLVGGSGARLRKVNAGNTGAGIQIRGQNIVVQGNFIGTNAAGTAALANSGDGVSLEGTNNVIGGTIAGTRNVISGNAGAGVMIDGQDAKHNAVQGNF